MLFRPFNSFFSPRHFMRMQIQNFLKDNHVTALGTFCTSVFWLYFSYFPEDHKALPLILGRYLGQLASTSFLWDHHHHHDCCDGTLVQPKGLHLANYPSPGSATLLFPFPPHYWNNVKRMHLLADNTTVTFSRMTLFRAAKPHKTWSRMRVDSRW